MAAAVVLTGVYTFQQYKSNVKNEMEKIEKESQKELEQYQSADAGDVINEAADDVTEEGISDFSPPVEFLKKQTIRQPPARIRTMTAQLPADCHPRAELPARTVRRTQQIQTALHLIPQKRQDALSQSISAKEIS